MIRWLDRNLQMFGACMVTLGLAELTDIYLHEPATAFNGWMNLAIGIACVIMAGWRRA